MSAGFRRRRPTAFSGCEFIRRDDCKDPVSGYAGFVTRFEIDDEYEIEVVAAFYGDDFAGKRRFEATL